MGIGTAAEASLGWGHCLAAGWLAPRALGAGLIGMPGALPPTLETVIGLPARAVAVPAGAHAPAAEPAGPGDRAARLLAALS